MSEKVEVLETLQQAKVIDLFAWAGRTAYGRVFEDFDEDAGHDQAVVGLLGYKYLINLFDRAAACGKYSLPPEAPTGAGRDLLQAGISDEALDGMPRFAPGSIVRSNFNGSPGWACGETRWLLQSFKFGGIDRILWTQKSGTKRRIAHHPFLDDPSALFSLADLGIGEEDLVDDLSFVGKTLILAHAFDRASGGFEMYIGRSREMLFRRDTPWHWRELVASGGSKVPSVDEFDSNPDLPGMPATSEIEDMPVRLRPVQEAPTTKKN